VKTAALSAYHVTVIGGGSAGVAAAISAARAGAHTLLIESSPRLGGMGSNAFVHTFCGLYHPDISQGPQWLNPGLPTEIGQRLLALTAQSAPDLMGRVYVLRQHPDVWAELAATMVATETTLTLHTETELVGINQSASGWQLSLSRSQLVTTQSVIDCSGDALVARLLGDNYAEISPGARLYRPAMIGIFPGVSAAMTDSVRLGLAAHLARAIRAEQLPATAAAATFRSSPCSNEVFVSLDLDAGDAAWDPLEPASTLATEAAGAAILEAIWSFLKANHPDFGNLRPMRLPPKLGVRESARWRGDYTLTASDLINSRRFSDEVALAGWPLEKRETARGPKFTYFDRPQPAGIPQRCLQRKDLPGIFFAGRCLSADHDAMASTRVMGTCLATGSAAGRIACKWIASRQTEPTAPMFPI
jgi:FAD dependent oxidoreductase